MDKILESVLIGIGSGVVIGVSIGMLFKADNTIVEQVPGHSDSGSQWVSWHTAMVGRFGVQEANQLFMLAYNKQNPDIMGDSTIRQYFESNGLVFSTNLLNASIDTIHNITSGIGSGISGFLKTSKTVVYILIGTFLVAVVLLFKGVSSHPEYISAATKAFA